MYIILGQSPKIINNLAINIKKVYTLKIIYMYIYIEREYIYKVHKFTYNM